MTFPYLSKTAAKLHLNTDFLTLYPNEKIYLYFAQTLYWVQDYITMLWGFFQSKDYKLQNRQQKGSYYLLVLLKSFVSKQSLIYPTLYNLPRHF